MFKVNTSSLIYQWIKKAINDEEIILFDDSDSTFRNFIFIDYSVDQIIGREYVQEIKIIKLFDTLSTSNILNSLKS